MRDGVAGGEVNVMAMKMPIITDCQVEECSYNKGKKCHASAITVGDSKCPCCDTYTKMSAKGGDPSISGGVGACKVDNCKYNTSLECGAGNIHVGMHSGRAECLTFAAR
jgi:hypothetical protein